MTIDAHQYFWKYEPTKHGWIDDSMPILQKDFMPEDLQLVYKATNIDGCIAVQAVQTLEETDFLLDLAEQNQFIKGVVGWVDLRADNIEAVLKTYSSHKKLKGFRHIVQDEADPNFLLRPQFLRGITALAKYNYTYDILVYPHQLGAVLELTKRFPAQKFVINHIAKPHIKDSFYDGWAALMFEIGKQKNVYCKLAGMITEADYNTWTPQQIVPYMKLVLVAFGWKRIMFGSDWPVCLVAGNYEKVKKLVTDFISNLSETEQASIMGENALKFYNIN